MRGGFGGVPTFRGAWGTRGFHGYTTGRFWGGGWWRGGWWPRAWYGPGFAWFLPVLPVVFTTFVWDGIPYYYANNAYYTWSPDYNGYVATDPPPVADGSAAAPSQGVPPSADANVPPEGGAPLAGAGAPGTAPPGPAVEAGPPGAQIFMYPKNGQSPEQQAADKQECERWASNQVGLGSNGPDYRRAMVACVEGRGYSVQ